MNYRIKLKKISLFIFLFISFLISAIFWWHYFGNFEISNDAVQYHNMALSLLNDHRYALNGELTMMREPGYSFFLFLVYKLFGVNPMAVRIIQIFLHFFIVVGIYFLANKFFNKFVAGLGAFLVATYPMFHILTSYLLSEIFAGWLLMVFLLIFYAASVKDRYYLYAISGLFLGFFVLVKSAFILTAPLVFFYIFFYAFGNNFLEKSKKAIVFAVFFSLAVVPWLARNYADFGQLSLTSRSGGMVYTRAIKNTYNQEDIKKYVISAFSGEYLIRRFIDSSYIFENDYIRKGALNDFIRKWYKDVESINYDVVDVEMRKKGIELIAKEPLKYFMFGLVEINNLNSPMIYYERHISIFHDNIYTNTFSKILIIVLLRIGWWLFLFFVIFASFRLIRERKVLAYPWILFIIEINFVLFFLQGNPRFLIPVFPLYLMLAAYGLNLLARPKIAIK